MVEEPIIDISYLKSKASWLRRKVFDVIVYSKKGHIGGSLSCVDIMTFLYYGGGLKYSKHYGSWVDRDRFILSKGHASVVLYSILSDIGFIEEDLLSKIGQEGSILGGHPTMDIEGVEVDTGSLGNGPGVGCGMAWAAKMNDKKHYVIVLMGDGECYEGSVWEAAMFASHQNLNNLIFIVDRNNICATDFTEDCNKLEFFPEKWKAFNWDVYDINGHSFKDMMDCFKDIKMSMSNRPSVIIARTVKGKGISYMENNPSWHHGIPNESQKATAIKDLKCLLD